MLVGGWHFFEQFDDIGIFDSDESDVCAEALAAGAHQDDIGHILKVLHLPKTSSFLSDMPEVMSAVDQQEGIVFFCDFLIEVKIGWVTVHWEKSLRDDKDSAVWVFGSGVFQQVDHGLLIEVFKFFDVFGGGIGAFLEAVVG